MDITAIRRKAVAAAAGLVVTASALPFLGAGIAAAGEFDPQPDPPGQSRGFDPKPEPPTKHLDKFNPAAKLAQVNVGR